MKFTVVSVPALGPATRRHAAWLFRPRQPVGRGAWRGVAVVALRAPARELTVPRAGHDLVRRSAKQQRIEPPGHVPPYVVTRLMSLRALDQAHTIVHAKVVAGSQVGEAIERAFARDTALGYSHLHNARPGCCFRLAGRAQ